MSDMEALTLKSWQELTFKAAQELCLAIDKDPTMPSLICGRRQFLAPRTIRALRDLAVTCGFSDSKWSNADTEDTTLSTVEFPSKAIARATQWESWHTYQHRGRYHLGRFPEMPTAYIPGLGTIHPCLGCGALVAGGVTRCLKCVADIETGEK